ncbi:unnamed protein product [Adineta ricciae]|uniref:Uncharacterized protein n=1 Tax=Adineta ricciae TaxID=249248 RepID=A0A815SSW5_ADIRI|nr:unnamed protein product [Adineta ricciae]CAF1640123.1 unnamed protein product [Adineta ricciae]
MTSEEVDTDNSENSRSDVSALDAGFMKMEIESPSFEKEFSDSELIILTVNPTSRDNTIYPIDCYRHFIIDETMVPSQVNESDAGSDHLTKSDRIPGNGIALESD